MNARLIDDSTGAAAAAQVPALPGLAAMPRIFIVIRRLQRSFAYESTPPTPRAVRGTAGRLEPVLPAAVSVGVLPKLRCAPQRPHALGQCKSRHSIAGVNNPFQSRE